MFTNTKQAGTNRRHLLNASSASLILAAAFAGAWGEAHAADTLAADNPTPVADAASAEVAEEVTITARRRKEVLQDVPLAVTALTGKELNDQHLDRFADYGQKVPNFGALQQNPRVSSTAIRGIGGNANNDGAESGVGLIVDNVFQTHIGFSWNDFTDLEGIEVVRGPQGTLLGKNTTVGAVIIKTKGPSFTPETRIDATLGNHGRKTLRLSTTGPLIEDKLAFRLALAKDKGDGWVDNRVDGEQYLDQDRWSLRGQLLWTPTANITSRLIVDHLESKEYNNFYPVVGDANFNYNLDGSVYTTTANPTGARANSWTNVLKTRFGYTPGYYGLDQETPQNADLNQQERIVSKVDGLSNELNWTFNGLTLTSITAWRKFYFRPYNDSDGTPYSILRGGYDVDVDQYSQEFRLANSESAALDWQVGAFYLRQDLSSHLHYLFGSDATTFFVSPALPASLLDGVDLGKWGRSWTRSSAVFGQATWHVSPRVDVTAGVRYSSEDKRVNVIGSVNGGAAVTGTLAAYRAATLASFNGTYAALGGVYNAQDARTQESVSWLINPSFKLTDDILFYASASYGEKSGAANTTASPVSATFTQPLIIEPEESLDFEGGFKSSWFAKSLVVNLNLYNNTIKNYQAAQISPTVSLASYLANVGKVRLQGAEIETRYTATDNLSLYANVGVNDAKYVAYDNAPAPIELQASAGSILSLSGKQLVGAPKYTLQAGFDYKHSLGDNLELFAYGNGSHRTKAPLYNPRSQFGWQEDFTVYNGGLGVRTADNRYSLLLWGKNLSDERYYVGYGSASAANGFIGILGDPRTFGLTFTGRF
ncbi:MAG: TonB-dependent receptor [Asticcacaulis sp.]